MAGTIGVSPEVVIGKMQAHIGQLYAELAMREAALEAAHERIAELEQSAEAAAEPAP